MRERDIGYLWDIIHAIREVSQFVAGKRFGDFDGEALLRRGVERDLEIIGEAARRLSTEFRNDHPEVPWRRMIGLRNILAHEYGDVRVERIWLIATQDVPQLRTVLEALISSDPDAPAE